MTDAPGLDWARVNAIFAMYFGLAVVTTLTTGYQILGQNLLGISIAILVSLYPIIIKHIGKAIRIYVPKNLLDAKRVNEQIKSMASMLNTVATASVVVFVFSEVREGFDPTNALPIIFAAGFAYVVHVGGRTLLGYLKDEREAAYSVAKTGEAASK